MKRRLIIGFLIAVIALTVAVPVLAYLYRAPLTIASNYTDYTALPVTCLADVDWLITNGFITTATALDTRVETLGGTAQLHMMAEDRIMAFCPTLDGYSQLNWYLTTGNTPQADFPVIVGVGGYVTITDHANLELGDDFELEWDGYIDTTVGDDLISKTGAINVTSDGMGNITASIYGPADISQANTDSADGLFAGGTTRAGQRIDDVPACNITSVSFYLCKAGAPAGTAYARVRRVSDDGILGTVGIIDVATLAACGGGEAWYVFNNLTILNPTEQDLRFILEYSGGNVGNNPHVAYDNADDTIDGSRTYYDGAWHEDAADDCTINITFDSINITTTVSPGECRITVAGDGTNLKIYEDGVEEVSSVYILPVIDNGNNWILGSDVTPYYNNYTHTVSGVLRITYEPDDLISGTTLVNEENPGTYDGVITWGTNPSGVTAVLGSLTVPETTVTVEGAEAGYQGAMHEVGVTDWFLEPDVGTKLAAHPLRPLVTIWSDNSTVTEVQAWRFLGLALLLLITVVAAVMLRGHLLIAGLACGGTIAVLVQQTIWPAWTLVFIIPAIIAGVMAERTPSIG